MSITKSLQSIQNHSRVGSRRRGIGQRLRTATYRGERIEWSAYLFVLPFLAFLLIFSVLPIVAGVFISFTEWGIVGSPKWIGMGNYVRILHDADVPLVYGNTLRYAATVVPGTTLVALLMALFVNRRLIGSSLSRTIFFAPTVLSVTVTSIIWVWILDTKFGILNIHLDKLGIPNIPWLTNPQWVMASISLTSIWWNSGFSMVIFLAALQDIPRDLYDAAYVDGATSRQVLRYITLPLLGPAFSLVLTLSIIEALRVFSQMYLMTKGGPAGSSLSVIYLIYQKAFGLYQLGYGAALSLMLFGVIMAVTVIQLWLSRIFAK